MALECTGGEITLQEIIEDVNINTLKETNIAHPLVETAVPVGAVFTDTIKNRNILIDGEIGRINQSGFDGNWAGVSTGNYGYDIWIQSTEPTLVYQRIEEGNYKPNTVYTLSGNGLTTEQFTSPASGTWASVGIPNTATNVQLELGTVATEFEILPYSDQLARVQSYYQKSSFNSSFSGFRSWNYSAISKDVYIPIFYVTRMRDVPTATITVDVNDGSPQSPDSTYTREEVAIARCNLVSSGGWVDVHSWIFDARL